MKRNLVCLVALLALPAVGLATQTGTFDLKLLSSTPSPDAANHITLPVPGAVSLRVQVDLTQGNAAGENVGGVQFSIIANNNAANGLFKFVGKYDRNNPFAGSVALISGTAGAWASPGTAAKFSAVDEYVDGRSHASAGAGDTLAASRPEVYFRGLGALQGDANVPAAAKGLAQFDLVSDVLPEGAYTLKVGDKGAGFFLVNGQGQSAGISGTSVVIDVLPEPATALLLVAGAALPFLRRRRA